MTISKKEAAMPGMSSLNSRLSLSEWRPKKESVNIKIITEMIKPIRLNSSVFDSLNFLIRPFSKIMMCSFSKNWDLESYYFTKSFNSGHRAIGEQN